MISNEYLLLAASILLLLSILASKASSWLGIPALLLFLLAGIYFDDAAFAQTQNNSAL